MSNVLRSYAADAWLSPLPHSHKGGSARDKQTTIRIEKSRFSVSTINNDLLPELLTWSALMDSQVAPLAPEPIPKHPTASSKPGPVETDRERRPKLSLTTVLDPTTLEIGFDASCFDGLDDLLISSPLDVYAELCWSDGVVAHSRSKSEPITFAKHSPYPPNAAGHSRKHRMRSALVTKDAVSDDSDTDSDDECRTQPDEGVGRLLYGSGALSGEPPGLFPSYDDEKSLSYSDGHGVSSFMVFESHFSNPQESVGFFPIPVSPPKSVPRRFATFCSNLPASLPFVRPNSS